MRRGLGFALAALLVFAACSSDGEDDQPSATVPTVGSTTTTNADDEFAIPAVIDEAYVQRVIDKLYEIETQAVGHIIEEGDLVPAATDLLQAVFLSEELNAQLAGWNDLIRGGELASFRKPPGDVDAVVTDLLTAGPSCVFVKTREDASASATSPQEPYDNYLMLRAKDPRQDSSGHNPTPWMIAKESLPGASGTAENPCVG